MIALMAAGLAGFLALVTGLTLQSRSLRMGTVLIAPLLFVLVPLLQSVPIPSGLRHGLGATGTELLQEEPLTARRAWPLSLDPPSTRTDAGRAALALIAFLVAYHAASGQRRQLLLRVVAGTGIAAVVTAFGHRILGVPKLYGMLTVSTRPLLVGPFVNANHSAEFFELAGFLCLACSFVRDTLLNRIGWLVGAVLCFSGAAATLSRGAVLALTVGGGVFVTLRLLTARSDGETSRRSVLLSGAMKLGLLVAGALAVGAGQLIERFRNDEVTTDVRLRVWRDSLRVFQAHPFGIGRGAFDRVYPVYRTVRMPFPLRFAFVECEPLQLLIDCGWPFCLALLAGIALVVATVVRFGRRDRIEAALIAGAVAVLVHNIVDFGLETMGVLLPFAMVVGTILGRCQAPGTQQLRSGRRWAVVGLAAFGTLFGIASTASASGANFDALLKGSMPPAERLALLERAERAHPLDYLYPLEKARLDPLKGPAGTPSPRLHDLNRALRLCPTCETVHLEIARTLWRIGVRRQAVLEWRTALSLRPQLLQPTLGEMFAVGARPEEMTAVVSVVPGRLPDLAWYLYARGHRDEAFTVLDQADGLGVSPADNLLMRARILLDQGQPQLDQAAASIAAVEAMRIQDPQLAILKAKLTVLQRGADGADQALEVLDRAAERFPEDMPVQRARIELVQRYKRWRAAQRAIDGYRIALYHLSGRGTEAHIWAARIEGDMGHWSKALEEYRMALTEAPTDLTLWMELAHAAEAAGRYSTAREAYEQAARISPNSPDIAAARRALESHQDRLREVLRDSDSPAPQTAP